VRSRYADRSCPVHKTNKNNNLPSFLVHVRWRIVEPYSGKEPEITMNKILTVALIAGGLLLLDSPEAAAHQEIRSTYQPYAHYRLEHRRSDRMPYWLKRNQSFRKWYRQTRLRKNRHLAWHRLFDIYRWQRIEKRQHRRGERFADNRYYYRHHDHDAGRRYRH